MCVYAEDVYSSFARVLKFHCVAIIKVSGIGSWTRMAIADLVVIEPTAQLQTVIY